MLKFQKLTNVLKLHLALMVVLFSAIEMVQAQSPFINSWAEAQRQETAWYGSDDAVRIAENILLYQKENGGWYKNINMAEVLSDKQRAKLRNEKKKIVGTTIDNNATHTQMRFLAKVYNATRKEEFKEGFLRGFHYLLDAQYDNGGWAQYHPQRKGYYEHITFNDHAMIGVMEVLRDVVEEKEPYTFVDEKTREEARQAIDRGVEVILNTQIEVDGELTAWCAQHHKEDLSPAKARAYELPSISGGESVGVVRFLMGIEDPSPAVKQAIQSAVNWFDKVKIEGIKVKQVPAKSLPKGYDRVVVRDGDGGPLWARFYEIGTNKPMFVGRDSKVKYQLSEIEHERRVGYSYLGNYAEELLEKDYPQWKEINNEPL